MTDTLAQHAGQLDEVLKDVLQNMTRRVKKLKTWKSNRSLGEE